MIQTKRLVLSPATDKDIEQIIKRKPVLELKLAYQEMLKNCRLHSDKRELYALWLIKSKENGPERTGFVPTGGMGEEGPRYVHRKP